jgi:hypothetical protein
VRVNCAAKATRTARGAMTAAGGRRRPLGGGRPNDCHTREATTRRRLEASLTGRCSWWRVELAWQQGHAAPATERSWPRSEERRLGALSRWARSEDAAVRNRLGRYCSTGSGPIQCTVLFCKYSKLASISKYKVKTVPMSKIIETWHGARVDPSKQFLPLGPLPILNRTQVIKFGTPSTLNLSLNF